MNFEKEFDKIYNWNGKNCINCGVDCTTKYCSQECKTQHAQKRKTIIFKLLDQILKDSQKIHDNAQKKKNNIESNKTL